eukprot:3701196-Rhodomonas_salina.2
MPSWLSACLVVTLSLIALGVKSASAFAPGGFHIALSQRTALRHTHERCLSVPWSMEENDQRKLLRVVGAVMEDGDRVLMAQRPAGKSMGGLWEFPGGKVEEGESDEEALARECMEELGVEVRVLPAMYLCCRTPTGFISPLLESYLFSSILKFCAHCLAGPDRVRGVKAIRAHGYDVVSPVGAPLR